MLERNVTLINKLGLHARAAAKLCNLAAQYPECKIEIKTENASANAHSIMSVMILAAACGTPLTLSAEGEQAREALDALEALILQRFDEEQ